MIMYLCSLKRILKLSVWSHLFSRKSALLTWTSYGREFSLKPMKVNGEVPLGLQQNLHLPLVKGIITDRQISASLSCQSPDFLHPSLPHSIFGRGLKIIQESWLFFEPWGVTHRWRNNLWVQMWGQTYNTSIWRYPNFSPALFLLLKFYQHRDKSVSFCNFCNFSR